MLKIILGIDGMGCGACEAHVNDVIRRNFKIKKVKSSHIKNETIIITPINISEQELHTVLDPTGYRVTSYQQVEAKKTLFSWK